MINESNQSQERLNPGREKRTKDAWHSSFRGDAWLHSMPSTRPHLSLPLGWLHELHPTTKCMFLASC